MAIRGFCLRIATSRSPGVDTAIRRDLLRPDWFFQFDGTARVGATRDMSCEDTTTPPCAPKRSSFFGAAPFSQPHTKRVTPRAQINDNVILIPHYSTLRLRK